MSLLPSIPDVEPDGDPRVVDLDSEEADALMAALSSSTARRLLTELHERPAPPSDLAERVDTSLQNAQYHLERLEDAGAIEVVDTAYSEKGREMRVYGPADSPLVIFAGREERASGLRAALSRLFGGFAALAAGGLAIQQVFGERLIGGTDDGGPAGGDSATPTPDPAATSTPTGDDSTDDGEETTTPAEDAEDGAETATEREATETTGPDDGGGADGADGTAEPSATETTTPTEDAATPVPDGDFDLDLPGLFEGAFEAGLPPGLAFFLGGAIVLTVYVGLTYYRTYP